MRESKGTQPAGKSAGGVRERAAARKNPGQLVGSELVARLQADAGNRAVAAMMDGTVQRHVSPTLDAEVGTEPGTGTGTPAPAGPDYAALAKQIQNAIEGLGTNEAAVYSALRQCGRDATKIAALSAVYVTLTGRTLEADIRGDFSGDELKLALSLITPPSRQELIETQMRSTDSGKWALEVIANNSITVDWEYTGTGSFHQGGKIFLNKTTPVVGSAIAMMHEAQHALTFKSGKAADAAKLTRAAFVTAKIADEAEAVVRAIEGAGPMAKAGADIAGSGLTAGLIKQYQDAHAAEVKKLKDADPALSDAVAAAKARTTIRDGKVTNWFHDGTFVTSTGPITYSEHYGKIWDGVHVAPTTPAGLPTTNPSPVINA
ncbi:MAG TPA: hypothetical protein VFG33_23080 [Kribbella sp.]|uniref:hypothetical protein n=1 Tax=Kribbella sp. TaxID=1871183 RepID=UPI002D77DF51|nr:hypothetical protein [Kribbella sp.]HET6296286.1 hypothetical protein [Kribbella sp.]